MAPGMNKREISVAGDERCRFRPIKGGGLRMVLRVTMKCDLACPHCLAAKRKGYAELATRQWLTLISQFPGIGVEKVLLTGGEPLLRDDIVTIVEAISHVGIQADLNSNLQRMDLGLIRELKQAGLSEISVSLEGPEEVHDRMHGRIGSYARLIEAINWAAENNIPVDTSCCLTKDNYNHIVDLINIAGKLPVRSLTFSRLLPIGHGYGSRLTLTQEQLNACYDSIQREMVSGAPIPIRVTGLLGAPRQKDCERGTSLIAISPDGRLLGCVLTEDNPSIQDPLKTGLRPALEYLRGDLSKHQFAQCWQEGT